MIKAVFFDIDDTLYCFRDCHARGMAAITAYAEKRLGVAPEDFNRALKEAETEIYARLGFDNSAIHNRQIRFQRALEILGLPIYPHTVTLYNIYWDTMISYAEPEPGLLDFIDRLKEMGIYIGIVTDMTTDIQWRKLAHLGIAPLVDGFVASETAGVEKPGHGVYELCRAGAGCAPEECLVIGDNPDKDMAGARGAGMEEAWYCRYCTAGHREGIRVLHSFWDCLQGDKIVVGDLEIRSLE